MNFCGIDVSAQELVVKVRRQEREEGVRRLANTRSGHKALLDYLLGRQSEPMRVCLEASGNYSLEVGSVGSGGACGHRVGSGQPQGGPATSLKHWSSAARTIR